MSREVKRVALDFDWPLDEIWKGYQPPDDAEYDEESGEYADWKPYDPPAGDGWQVWEDTSEGSPITPVFSTREALIEHLVTVGTTWDQISYPGRPAPGPWRRSAAEAFVEQGWTVSFIMVPGVGLLEGGRDEDKIKALRSPS